MSESKGESIGKSIVEFIKHKKTEELIDCAFGGDIHKLIVDSSMNPADFIFIIIGLHRKNKLLKQNAELDLKLNEDENNIYKKLETFSSTILCKNADEDLVQINGLNHTKLYADLIEIKDALGKSYITNTRKKLFLLHENDSNKTLTYGNLLELIQAICLQLMYMLKNKKYISSKGNPYLDVMIPCFTELYNIIPKAARDAFSHDSIVDISQIHESIKYEGNEDVVKDVFVKARYVHTFFSGNDCGGERIQTGTGREGSHQTQSPDTAVMNNNIGQDSSNEGGLMSGGCDGCTCSCGNCEGFDTCCTAPSTTNYCSSCCFFSSTSTSKKSKKKTNKTDASPQQILAGKNGTSLLTQGFPRQIAINSNVIQRPPPNRPQTANPKRAIKQPAIKQPAFFDSIQLTFNSLDGTEHKYNYPEGGKNIYVPESTINYMQVKKAPIFKYNGISNTWDQLLTKLERNSIYIKQEGSGRINKKKKMTTIKKKSTKKGPKRKTRRTDVKK